MAWPQSIANSDYYLEFLLHKGTQEYLQTEGNLSVKLWHKKEADCCHFWTVTEWQDIDAIKKFAGANYDKAVYYAEDEGILLEKEKYVLHCETDVVFNGLK
jgi:heme-degrading monooxygenase HmoA